MDVEYIRLLMEYSDMKYPFVKAKSDPGLSEGLKSTSRFLRDHGSRKINHAEANRMMLLERQAQHALNRKVRNSDSLMGRDVE
jgi:hypothetical protein